MSNSIEANCIEISTPGGPDVLVPGTRSIRPPSTGEVRIEVKAAGVNRPDVFQRLGAYPPPKGASDIPGLEVAGIIESVGDNVTDFVVGDRVMALVTGGGYADYAVAPVETTLSVPNTLSLEEAAGIPETFFTVWLNVFDRGALKSGEDFLVHGGSSGIGSTAIQLAKAFGARVFTTAGSVEKCEFCKKIGADFAINYKTHDFVEEISTITNGNGINLILDMVAGDYTPRNISITKPDGRIVIIALLGGSKAEIDLRTIMMKRIAISGSTLRARDNIFKGEIAASLKKHVWPLFEAGTVRPIIYETLPLSEAHKAHALMETSRHMGKIILSIP